MQGGNKWIHAQMIGLMIFIAVLVGDLVGIVLDIWLRADGRPTITESVRADPIWIVPLIGAHMAQALGLLVHLWPAALTNGNGTP